MFLIFILALLILAFLRQKGFIAPKGNEIDTPEYILYVPEHIDNSTKHPIVIALSPSGDAQSMLAPWKEAADKYQWIIYASKTFRNGLSAATLPAMVKNITKLSQKYPIDMKKIIASGLSGGGMCAYFAPFDYPEMVKAVISNVGVIHEVLKNKKSYAHAAGKMAVFLASPGDFNYEPMKGDKKFLESIGWKTKWIEFKGGHTFAPSSAYLAAAGWVDERLKKYGGNGG